MERILLVSGVLVLGLACLDVSVSPELEVVCIANDACPSGAVCSPLIDRCVPPGDVVAPSLGLRGGVFADRITLSWAQPAATQVTAIVIERDGNLEVARLPSEATSTTDETVEFDTRYRYALRLEADGELFPPYEEDVLEILSAPRPVTNLLATAVGAQTVVTWANDNSPENAVGHRVTRDGEEVARLDGSDELEVAETLPPDSVVTYGVEVLGAFGNSVLATTPGRALPVAPAPVTVTTTGAHGLQVTWSDTSTHEDAVVVERLRDEAVEASFELPPDTVMLVDDALEAGATYHYRVQLVGPAGTSASAEGSDRTSRDPAPVLSAPSLDGSCTFSLAGDPGVDVDKGASVVTATVAIDTIDTPTASPAGISMPVTDLDRPGWNVDWTITDDLGGATTLSLFQPLSRVDLTQPDDLLPMLTAAERAQGNQLWDGAAEANLSFAPDTCGACSGQTALLVAARQRCFTAGPDRELFCMGSTPSQSMRVRLPEAIGLSDVRDMMSSNDHTCAIAGPQRAVFCWGQSSLGRLGDGSLITSAVTDPVQVCRAGTQVGDPSGPLCEPLVGVVDLTAGKFGNPQPAGTCALLDDGTAVCWGKETGQVFGNGSAGPADDVYRKPAPICIDDLDPCTPLDRIVALEVGSNGGCAIRDDEQVLCWGSAQLIRTTLASHLPTESMPELTGAVRISLGGQTGCAVMPDTTALCFGQPRQGVSGDGDVADDQQDPLPVCASGAHINGTCTPLTGVVDVVVQGVTACALLQDRTVMCWGQNYLGSLGSGLSASELANTGNPVQVCSPAGCPAPLDDIVALDVAHDAVCAVDMFGKAWCWGGNPLGNNETNINYRSPLPIQVCASSDCPDMFDANVRSCFSFDTP